MNLHTSAFCAPAGVSTGSALRSGSTFLTGASHISKRFQLCCSQRKSSALQMMLSDAPRTSSSTSVPSSEVGVADVGMIGLAVMGQNLALNIAEKGYRIAVYNRSVSKMHDTVKRASVEGLESNLLGYEDISSFVRSLSRPRKIIILVKAGTPVDATISALKPLLEEGDVIIDGGNEFYTNTERRAKELEEAGILYVGMGVSGGEDGARNGPSLMPGGPRQAWELLEDMLKKVSANVQGEPCVTYIGPGGAGNYVKMVHNGIEYGDMQLIGEVYDLLRNVAGMTPMQIAGVFEDWNQNELKSFLVEITAQILRVGDDLNGSDVQAALVDKVLDQTGSKGTGMWTIQEAAARGVPAPTIAAALDARYISSLKEERVSASKKLSGPSSSVAEISSKQSEIVSDLRKALYAAKICSYAQGMNLIRAAGISGGWNLDLGAIAKIWKGGCIIRAEFLDRIASAYKRDPELPSLLVDSDFANELADAQQSWRRVVAMAVENGFATPALSGSLAYYDAYRRDTLASAQMVQAQRDFFGAHTYKRLDREGVFHTRWSSDGVSTKLD